MPTFRNSLKIILRGSQISPLRPLVSAYSLATGLNLSLTDSSLLGIKRVASLFNLPSILPADEGPTLVKYLLKAGVMSFLSVCGLFSNSIIAAEMVLMFFQNLCLWFSTFSRGCFGYPKDVKIWARCQKIAELFVLSFHFIFFHFISFKEGSPSAKTVFQGVLR